MAGTPQIYTPRLNALLGSDDWVNDTHYAHLFTAYTFSAAHGTYGAMGSTTEVGTGGGYSRDGLLVQVEAITTIGDKVYLASSALDWGDPVTITAKYLVVFEKTSGPLDTGDTPVFYISLDDGEDVSSTSGAFKVSQHTDGGWLYFEQS